MDTKSKTTKTLNYFNRKCKYKFEDVSWGNDCTDSISTDLAGSKMLDVYLPNSTVEKPEKELFNLFTVRLSNYEDNRESVKDWQFRTATEVINFINKTL